MESMGGSPHAYSIARSMRSICDIGRVFEHDFFVVVLLVYVRVCACVRAWWLVVSLPSFSPHCLSLFAPQPKITISLEDFDLHLLTPSSLYAFVAFFLFFGGFSKSPLFCPIHASALLLQRACRNSHRLSNCSPPAPPRYAILLRMRGLRSFAQNRFDRNNLERLLYDNPTFARLRIVSFLCIVVIYWLAISFG